MNPTEFLHLWLWGIFPAMILIGVYVGAFGVRAKHVCDEDKFVAALLAAVLWPLTLAAALLGGMLQLAVLLGRLLRAFVEGALDGWEEARAEARGRKAEAKAEAHLRRVEAERRGVTCICDPNPHEPPSMCCPRHGPVY